MNIGIDVDGVLVDLEQYQLKYGELYFKEKYNKNVINPKAYDIKDIFDCTVEEREKFWKKYIWKYCLKEPMTSGAAETVNKLKKQGHKIFVITGRVHTTEKGIAGKLFRIMLKYWLRKNKFYYDEIIFCSEDNSHIEKMNICLRKKIDVMVDDKIENLLALKDKIQILCYSATWNEDIQELDTYRISEFSDVLIRIERIG